MSERPWSASGQAIAASGSAGDYTGNYTSLLLSLTVSTVASTGIVRDSAADGQAIYGRYADQTLINHGRISASGSDGLGVELRFGSSALENTGSISGAGGGVVLGSAGTIDNAGYIGGALGAVYAGNFSALNNSGTIESLANSAGQAVYLRSGSVANTAGGTIIGAAAGVVTHGAVSNGATIEATGTDADAVVASALVNTGRIDATGSHGLGVYLFGAGIAGGEGLLTNAAGGTILADGLDGGGIFVARGGGVTNGGRCRRTPMAASRSSAMPSACWSTTRPAGWSRAMRPGWRWATARSRCRDDRRRRYARCRNRGERLFLFAGGPRTPPAG